MAATLLLGMQFTLKADEYKEVVYAKNGSIIKGMITEIVPNESLKIQTLDGSVFVFAMDDVMKITKEIAQQETRKASTPKAVKSLRQSGYKGFADMGGGVCFNGEGSQFSLSTSHGYQFNPYIFLGAGAGFDLYYGDFAMPIYADFRANFINRNVTPFAGVKLGYSATSMSGVFFSPSLGLAFALSNGFGLNLSMAYKLQSYEYYDSYYGYGSYYDYTCRDIVGSFNFSVGFEF